MKKTFLLLALFALASVLPVSAQTQTSKLVNISTLGYVSKDTGAMIAGFVISGSTSKKVLIRAVGPGLKAWYPANKYNPDPIFEVYQGTKLLSGNDDWNVGSDVPGVTSSSAAVGAFPLENGSMDAASTQTLAPGAYTVVVKGGTNRTGVAEAAVGLVLLEVYEVP